MKKSILILVAFLAFHYAKALPTFICTSGGYLFYTYWYYDSQGNLAYTLESQGPGSCTGGPWIMRLVPINSGVGFNDGFATDKTYLTLAKFNTTPKELNPADTIGFSNILNKEKSNETFGIDPSRIDTRWAKSIAISNKLSIYTLIAVKNKRLKKLEISIWSVKNQNVEATLIDLSTKRLAFKKRIFLGNGKNVSKIKLLSKYRHGAYSLTVKSDLNTITTNVQL